MSNSSKHILPGNVKTGVTHTGQKLDTKFQIKDKTKDYHKDDLVYYSKCPESTINEDFIGETGRRIIQREANSCMKNLKIIDNSYHNNRFKRKLSEALYIKQYKPSLKTQEQSAQLKLFN